MAPADAGALDALADALALLGSTPSDLRARLPPSGYSEEGAVREVIEGVRDAIQEVPDLLRAGALGPAAAADVLSCYLFLEGLMGESPKDLAAAFASDPRWRELQALAAAARVALNRP